MILDQINEAPVRLGKKPAPAAAAGSFSMLLQSVAKIGTIHFLLLGFAILIPYLIEYGVVREIP